MTDALLALRKSWRARGIFAALAAAVMAGLGIGPSGAAASHDTITGISTDGDGAVSAGFGGASADGTRVFFTTSEALVAGDDDSNIDIYERSGGTTTGISTDGDGAFDADFEGASADGTRVFFETNEPLAGDGDVHIDVYEHSGGTTTGITTDGDAALPATFEDASADGTRVFFSTFEVMAAGDDDMNLDVYERSGATTTGRTTDGDGAFNADFVGATADGARVFFHTDEVVVIQDDDSSNDVYEHSGGGTTGISTEGDGAFAAGLQGASADGSRVFFSTSEPIVDDGDMAPDVYERSGPTTTGISTDGDGLFAASFEGASDDGTRVFFTTSEDLAGGDSDNSLDVYERSGATTTGISTDGNTDFSNALFQGSSSDGTRVFFSSFEALVDGDDDSSTDVYERSGGATSGISTDGDGAFSAAFRDASADGTRVFFETDEALVGGDGDADTDIYERAGETTTGVTTDGDAASSVNFAGASADGTRVFFRTPEALVDGDGDSSFDVYEASIGPPPDDPGGGGGASDSDPPNTTITKQPKDKTNKKTATFEFASSEPGSTFECSLDGKTTFKPCTSPFTVNVKKGKHTFQVQATDQAGNTDASPATDDWKRKRKR